ncbi:MAG: DUF1588 domain-containing protein [Planctomycetaceae bacterium]|nr:DUF1588 domain-containing protein [Planctomycetaceae bacterium]
MPRFSITCQMLCLLFTCMSSAAADVTGEQRTWLADLFEQHCVDCHQGADATAALDLSDWSSQLRTSDGANAKPDKRWAAVFEVLLTKQMPPVDADPLPRGKRQQSLSLMRSLLDGSGLLDEWRHKLLYPEYGNYVDHEALFDGSQTAVAWSPARLWKKSPHIFDSLANRGMGFRPGRYGQRSGQLVKLKQPFTIEDKAGVRDFAAVTLADSATLGTMLRNAEVLVDNHLAGALHERRVAQRGPIPEEQLPKDRNGKPIRPRFPATPAEFQEIILSPEPVSPQQIDAAVARMFLLVVERSPDKQEQQRYRELFVRCRDEGGQVEGLRMTLIAVAVSPPAVFRMELGQGPVDKDGRQLLGPAELAFAIAYSLTDEKPDERLLAAAVGGQLSSPADVRREVIRYWDDDAIAKPRILRFFHEYFGYAAAPGVFKDTARFGKDYRKVPERLVEDADTMVMHIVKRDQRVLQELLTSDQYFVSHSGDNEEEREIHDALQQFYDYYKDKPWREFPYKVPDEHMKHVRSIHKMFTHANGNVTKRWMNYLEKCDQAGLSHMPMGGARSSGRDYIITYGLNEDTFSYPVDQPFTLAPSERIGILMHPAWLIAHSLNLDNDPIRRGKWIRERLLADTVPELPITVDASIPEDHKKTLRERFAVTRQEQECWRCHVKMNPLGMPFELFDDFGRHRDVERLADAKQTRPVNSTGALTGTGDPQLDGEVDDPLELMRRLARSQRVRQSFVRHAFRYWMGRNEMLSDSRTLIEADRAYVDSGGSFRALVISLLTSDSFLYRKDAGQLASGSLEQP